MGSILELPLEDKHRLASRLHAQGGGSPFYIVEMVSALADEGMLAPTERGEWHLTTGERRLPLPTSVRDVMTRTTAPLSPAARVALEAAAVLALPFDRALLSEVSGRSPVAVDAAVEELLLQRLIRETGVPGCHEFAQELVRHHVERNVPVARGERLPPGLSAPWRRGRQATPQYWRRWFTTGLAPRRSPQLLAVDGVGAGRRRRHATGARGARGLIAAPLPSPAATDTAVAVLPFAVTGGQELGYLGDGVVPC